MNPERNRESNEIQEINQPKQVELTNAEKDEMKRDLEANPPTLDHQGELEQIKGKVDGQDKRQEENKTLANTEDVKNQDDSENKNSKEDAKTNVDAQNDVGDKNMRLERTESKAELDIERVKGHPKDMLVHENGETRELTKEEVDAIDKKVEEVEKERAEQKAATEKEYAEKLKSVEPDSREYYALQKEKADKLETIDKEYDKKGDEVEILKDLHKQGDKPKEGSEKGKTSDISVDRDELKTATPEGKQPKAAAGTKETKEDTKPEQDNVQETGEKTEKNRENNNVKETSGGENEKPKLDVEHVAGHPKDMLVHENGETRELTKEEVDAIDKKVEEVEKERAEQKAATEKEYAEKLKGVEPDTQEYYALQKEKADRLEAIDNEYDKKGDEVEILKDLHKQGDKPGEGPEKGKTSDISIDKDELKTATPEEKQPNPEAGTRESKEDTKPEQDNVQETGDKTENNRENNTVKETAEGENEKLKLDVEHVTGHPKDMLVHENGKTRELTKEEVEAIDKKVEEVEKERAEQKAATEKEYAEKLKGVEPDTQEYYALQKEKADKLEAIDKEYDKKGDEVEILKDLHKQGDKPGEGSEKGKRSDISIDKDELKTATPEEKQPNPEAGTKETKEDTKPEQDNVQETGDKRENNRENNTVKETAEGENEKSKLDVEHVAGHPKDMLVHENGKTRELTKEEVDYIDRNVEEVEKERVEQKAATEKEYAEKLKGVEPDTQEYYALQKEKTDKLEAIDKEYDKKADEVEILKDLHKQGDKPGEGSEKGKRSDISIGKDELKTATPEEKQPNPEAGTRETKEDTKPEQDNVQETGDKTEKNRENNTVKETAEGENEKSKLDVEHVAGHPKDMLVHENGKTRELTKEEVEAIDKKVEEVEKERAEQKEKADRLEAIDKEYDKKADEVEILKEMHKQGDKPEEGQEKGKRSDIAIDKDELRPATPEERKPEPAAEGKGANKETKGEAKPEQDKTQEAKESTGINQNIKENSGETKETPAYDVERVKGMPYEMGVHENGKLRSLTKEEAEQIGQRIENAEKEYAAKKAEIEAKIEEKYAKELKEAKPGSSEYYDAQRRKHEEKEAQLAALGKEYQKKTDPVEVFYDMKKQEAKSEEGSEKGKRNDEANGKDALKPAAPEEKKPEPAAEGKEANKEMKEEAKPEQDKPQGAKETTGSKKNIKEKSGDTKETPTHDVERVKDMPYEMGVHKNGKLRPLTKEEIEYINNKGEEIVKLTKKEFDYNDENGNVKEQLVNVKDKNLQKLKSAVLVSKEALNNFTILGPVNDLKEEYKDRNFTKQLLNDITDNTKNVTIRKKAAQLLVMKACNVLSATAQISLNSSTLSPLAQGLNYVKEKLNSVVYSSLKREYEIEIEEATEIENIEKNYKENFERRTYLIRQAEYNELDSKGYDKYAVDIVDFIKKKYSQEDGFDIKPVKGHPFNVMICKEGKWQDLPKQDIDEVLHYKEAEERKRADYTENMKNKYQKQIDYLEENEKERLNKDKKDIKNKFNKIRDENSDLLH